MEKRRRGAKLPRNFGTIKSTVGSQNRQKSQSANAQSVEETRNFVVSYLNCRPVEEVRRKGLVSWGGFAGFSRLATSGSVCRVAGSWLDGWVPLLPPDLHFDEKGGGPRGVARAGDGDGIRVGVSSRGCVGVPTRPRPIGARGGQLPVVFSFALFAPP